jgi:hypothetical protein
VPALRGLPLQDLGRVLLQRGEGVGERHPRRSCAQQQGRTAALPRVLLRTAGCDRRAHRRDADSDN